MVTPNTMINKKAQLELSFGMIFSIILIIIFISFAFYAIQTFIGVQNSVQVGKFASDFQNDIDNIWKGSQGLQKKEYFLPKKINFVCFADYSSEGRGENRNFYGELEFVYYENENLFFYPVGSAEGLSAKEMKHIDLTKTTETENPLCVKNVRGKISFTIQKDFNEALVTIT